MPPNVAAKRSPSAASMRAISLVVARIVALTSKKTRCACRTEASSAIASAARLPMCTRSVDVKPSVALSLENIARPIFVFIYKLLVEVKLLIAY